MIPGGGAQEVSNKLSNVHEAKHTESLEGEREQCRLVVGESDVLAIARFGVDVSHREQRSREAKEAVREWEQRGPQERANRFYISSTQAILPDSCAVGNPPKRGSVRAVEREYRVSWRAIHHATRPARRDLILRRYCGQ